MKITVFNGSPWGRDGHAYIISREFLLSAHQAGAKVRSVQLVEKEIHTCTGCGICFYKTPGECVFKDEMQDLIHKFLASDVVVFATPLYMDNVSTITKTFMDRLTPILEPHYEKDSQGQYRRGLRFEKHPKFMVISGCAMPEQNQFDILRFFFRRFARTMDTEVVGEIYRADIGILLLSEKDINYLPAVKGYKDLLRIAGQEFVTTGRISEETSGKLEEPLVDPDEYIGYANKLWDMILPKRTFLGVPIMTLKEKQHKRSRVLK
jgi:putative NADPH-quinone reductase